MLMIVYLMCFIFTLPWAYNKDDDDDGKYIWNCSAAIFLCQQENAHNNMQCIIIHWSEKSSEKRMFV